MARQSAFPNPVYLLLLLVGAFVMRGAGCAYNDIVDRDYDARVERTRGRPIPSKQVSIPQALAFTLALCLIGLLVLVQFNRFTVWLAIASLALVAVYPYMKRFTYWPQVMLGLTFKWGALVGWATIHGALAAPPLALYAGAVLWTIGYDTIYAHQDKEDDLMAGLKSTAIRFGAATKSWLVALYGGACVFWGLAGHLAGARLVFFTALAFVALQMTWQVATLDIDDHRNCLQRFRSNRLVGWALLAGLTADMALAAALKGG